MTDSEYSKIISDFYSIGGVARLLEHFREFDALKARVSELEREKKADKAEDKEDDGAWYDRVV